VKSHYEILGCSRKATTKELRLAFKKKALQFHPDVNPANRQKAERLFKEANTAFQVLSDEKKRREYDLEFFTQEEDEVDSDDVYYADEHYDREEEGYPRKRNIEDDEVIWNSDDPSHIEDADRNDQVRSSNQSSRSGFSNQPPCSGQSPRSGQPSRSERGGAKRRVHDAASWAARQSPKDDGTTPRSTVSSVLEDLLRRPIPASAAPSCNICHGSGRVSQARNYVITTIPCVCRTSR
jgi:curved DNA-binding protein CbpA